MLRNWAPRRVGMTPHSLRTRAAAGVRGAGTGGDTHGALQWVGVGILRGTLGG